MACAVRLEITHAEPAPFFRFHPSRRSPSPNPKPRRRPRGGGRGRQRRRKTTRRRRRSKRGRAQDGLWHATRYSHGKSLSALSRRAGTRTRRYHAGIWTRFFLLAPTAGLTVDAMLRRLVCFFPGSAARNAHHLVTGLNHVGETAACGSHRFESAE